MSSTPRPASGSTTPLTLQLPPADGSVSDARHAVGAFCRTGHLDALADDAELLTSELMTNACRCADGPVSLVAERSDVSVLVTVTDDSPQQVGDGARQVDPDSATGRGLFLVDQLAGSWGVTPQAAGKAVWFTLP